MTRRTRLAALTFLVVAYVLPGAARAHFGNPPLILVPADHVMPGRSFALVGTDLGGDAIVSLSIAQDDLVVRLGKVTAGSDGHFRTTPTLPPTFPDGYAKLVASSPAGSASTWVLVGERTESAPAASGGTDWGKLSAVILLAVLVAVAGAAVAVSRLRPARAHAANKPKGPES